METNILLHLSLNLFKIKKEGYEERSKESRNFLLHKRKRGEAGEGTKETN
jgi:hypothetical protein